MKLTEDLLNAVRSKLNPIFAKKTCEMCDAHQWEISEYVVSIPNFQPAPNEDTHFLAVEVICANCGNIKFFSTGILGLRAINPRDN